MRLILWRIPRTGTTSIRQGLRACGLTESGLAPSEARDRADFVSDGHVRPQQAIERGWLSRWEFENRPKLIIVRHPAERLVSTWCLFQQSASLREERLHPEAPKTWKEYVEWCCQGKRAKEYHQVNYQCWPAAAWLDYQLPDEWRSFVPKPIRIYRFEQLNEAWEWLMDIFKPIQRRQLPHVNGSQHGDALSYFTSKQREMVSRAYAWEMAEFGYSWRQST